MITLTDSCDNLDHVTEMMAMVAALGSGNRQPSLSGEEVAVVLFHFVDQLRPISAQLAALTAATVDR
jgi:hypothetical protein